MGNTPSATTPGNPPTGATDGTGLCCTCPVEGDVDTNGEGTYFNTNYPPQGAIWNTCRLKFTRSGNGGVVEITIRYCLSYMEGAKWDVHGPQMHALIQAAQTKWNTGASRLRLQIMQDGCPEQLLRIQFKFEIAPSVDDYDVSIYANNLALPPNPTIYDNRSYVDSGEVMVFYLNTPGGDLEWIMFHEFGHVMGQPDEYVEVPGSVVPSGEAFTYVPTGPVPKVSYHRTATQPSLNNTPSPTVIELKPVGPGEIPGTYLFDLDSVMGQFGSHLVYSENLSWIALEAEKMFAAQGTTASAAILSA